MSRPRRPAFRPSETSCRPPKDDIRDQRAAVESARQHLEHDRQKARELAKEVERDKKKYGELRAQYEADQRLLKVAREELESARSELRQQNEKFEASRVAYMEERAQVAKKEADIHKALKQLRDERKRLQPGEDALSTWSLTQTPKETVADLQILLGRLHDERTRLKVEREQLAQIFSLISRAGGLGGTRATKSGSRQDQGQHIDGPRLRMILEPGTASSSKLSDLLSELSLLDRLLGGPGVEFVVRECRIWQLSALATRTAPDQSTAVGRTQTRGTARSVVRRDLCHSAKGRLERRERKIQRVALGPVHGESVHGPATRCGPGELL